MRAASKYSTMAATLLMLVAGSYLYAEDGGKGGNNGGNNNGNAAQVRLRANLTGPGTTANHPEGNADFRMQNGRTRLNVEVENINLPAGTVLTVAVIHAGASTMVGTIKVAATPFENELELDSQNGAMVPAIVPGDMVTVSNGATVILAGVF